MGGERLLTLLISQEDQSGLGLIAHLCVLAPEQGADGGDWLLPQSYPPQACKIPLASREANDWLTLAARASRGFVQVHPSSCLQVSLSLWKAGSLKICNLAVVK